MDQTPQIDGGPVSGRKRSEKRQRTALIQSRVTPEEKAQAEASALADGLDLAAFVRKRVTGKTGPRIRPPRMSPDLAALANLRGELGYVGNNLNQLTRLANMGDLDRPRELDDVLSRLLGLMEQIDDVFRKGRK